MSPGKYLHIVLACTVETNPGDKSKPADVKPAYNFETLADSHYVPSEG